ncbi:MAG: DUF6089 family protein [Bacteroidota bacterium]
MRTLFSIFILTVCTISRLAGQTYFTSTETGVLFGASQYFGDLNDNYGFKSVSPSVGIYARKHLSQYISVKLSGIFTHVGYSDKDNRSEYQRQRNLDFESNIYEVGVQAEFNFFRYVTGDPYYRFTPYLTGGIGAFYYDPYTNYQGTKYHLRPLGTEGQNTPAFKDRKYGSVSACFPIGVGVKFWLKGGINLTAEIADRLTTTDYLDDVSTTYAGAANFPSTGQAYLIQDRSTEINTTATPLGRAGKQRGNTSSLDQYIVAQVSISWHFKTYHCPSALSDEMIRVR